MRLYSSSSSKTWIESFQEIWLIFSAVWLELVWIANSFSTWLSSFWKGRLMKILRLELTCWELWLSKRKRPVNKLLQIKLTILPGCLFTHHLKSDSQFLRYLLTSVINLKGLRSYASVLSGSLTEFSLLSPMDLALPKSKLNWHVLSSRILLNWENLLWSFSKSMRGSWLWYLSMTKAYHRLHLDCSFNFRAEEMKVEKRKKAQQLPIWELIFEMIWKMKKAIVKCLKNRLRIDPITIEIV